jgi:hypothetical protein
MKSGLSLILFAVFVLVMSVESFAQYAESPDQSVESLRAQLLDVQAKEAELQARSKQLDEELKPENIERAFLGVGTTRPEELREARRRQLSSEKAVVLAQLEQLASTRTRLESSILNAQAVAYQKSAEGPATNYVNQSFISHFPKRIGWVVGMLTGFVALVGIVAFLLLFRRS